jgi:hypothetical protein
LSIINGNPNTAAPDSTEAEGGENASKSDDPTANCSAKDVTEAGSEDNAPTRTDNNQADIDRKVIDPHTLKGRKPAQINTIDMDFTIFTRHTDPFKVTHVAEILKLVTLGDDLMDEQ